MPRRNDLQPHRVRQPRVVGHGNPPARQRLLETTSLPVDQVAASAGFGTPAAMRLQFRQALDTSPAAYRQTFRSSSGVEEAGWKGRRPARRGGHLAAGYDDAAR